MNRSEQGLGSNSNFSENKKAFGKIGLEYTAQVGLSVSESLKLSTPVWPLQNTVAVNPFWFYRDRAFSSVLGSLQTVVKAPLFMPNEYFVERYRQGGIEPSALVEAAKQARAVWKDLPLDAESLVSLASSAKNDVSVTTYAEVFGGRVDWNSRVVSEVGKFAAAYLDELQALAEFPWSEGTFWNSWVKAQSYDASMEMWGAKGFAKHLEHLNGLLPDEAICSMLAAMGIQSATAQVLYTQRLVATVLGWSTQFKYLEWQKQLGYAVSKPSDTAESLLAVRLAYDYALFCMDQESNASQVESWKAELVSRAAESEKSKSKANLGYVFQLASELTYQKKIAREISASRSVKVETTPSAQLVFCIDVRSEMLRRHIEQVDPTIQTVGFAGFFGVPFKYKALNESMPGNRLPVLLSPAFSVDEVPTDSASRTPQKILFRTQVASLLRNYRKNPLSSFMYVELVGGLYIPKIMSKTLRSAYAELKPHLVPKRFRPEGLGPSQTSRENDTDRSLSLSIRADRAEFVLRHMGLVSHFAPIVMIVGHGSQTNNNAFGSSLDCGACGGHAGDINARFAVDLLNEDAIREELAQRGINVPSTTRFVAAIHETVTDGVYVIEPDQVGEKWSQAISQISSKLNQASALTRDERVSARSDCLDPAAARRSASWSEVRPEWGLAGNACFIVAPRERTQGLNLSSRAFLHDYDYRKDEGFGYKTLELIMTAPMIVTNWINLQYYASTVAPKVYGSGSKILHNLVNESGVLEGNSGDLRVGLPIQSVHDGQRFVHEPLRLTVYIEAPRDRIEQIIEKHAVVKELIDNEWLHIVHIDPSDQKSLSRRLSGGQYTLLN